MISEATAHPTNESIKDAQRLLARLSSHMGMLCLQPRLSARMRARLRRLRDMAARVLQTEPYMGDVQGAASPAVRRAWGEYYEEVLQALDQVQEQVGTGIELLAGAGYNMSAGIRSAISTDQAHASDLVREHEESVGTTFAR